MQRMKSVRMHARALVATFLAAIAAPVCAAAAELQVMIPNLRPQGSVVISIYADPVAWRDGGSPIRTAVTPVEDGMAVARFDVPPGRYAAVAFQDRNGDGRLNALPFGWPMEPVGYSGGVRPLFGRPSWDRADFGISEDERTTVFVRLR